MSDKEILQKLDIGSSISANDMIVKQFKEIERLNKIIEIKNNRIQQLMKRTRSAVIDKALEYIYLHTTQRHFFFDNIDRHLRGKPDFKGDISELIEILKGSEKE